MKKEAVLIGFVLIIVMQSFFVSAVKTTSNLQIEGKNYNIELTFVESGKAQIQVNDENSGKINVQTGQPYSVLSVGGLKIIVKNVRPPIIVGREIGALIWIGIEFNLNSSYVQKNLTIDGEDYIIELIHIDATKMDARITINDTFFNININQKKESSPYYFWPNSSYAQRVQGLDIILKNLTYQGFVGGIQEVTLLVGKDVNFSLTDSCESECYVLDEKTCENTNSYKICGEFDDDVCREWGNITNCGTNKVCSNGVCINNTTPPPTPTCDDDCSSGEKQCIGNKSYKVCGSFDEDECLEWSVTLDCLPEKICENKSCIQKVSPSPEPEPKPENYCETIGLRKSQNYCSSNNLWRSQKSEGTSCENNFECKTNICSESKCASKIIPPSPDNKIIWIIIGIIGVIIVFIIILFSVLRKNQ